jgi:hypothetical protein
MPPEADATDTTTDDATNATADGTATVEPTIASADEALAKATARIAELEAAAADVAPLVEIGSKTARAETVASLLGTARIAKGAEAAFNAIMDATANALGINLSRPMPPEQRSKLIEAVDPLLRPLLEPRNPAPGPTGNNSNSEPRQRRGL